VLRLPGVAVVAGVVASDVPDVVVAVLEDAEAEEDADDERDHQEHEQEAPHVLLSPREHAHPRLRLLPALPLHVGRWYEVLQRRAHGFCFLSEEG
jgi:hypothetical protein